MASEGSFWGIEVKPGKPERLESPEGAFQIHLSQASLAEDVKAGQKARVSLAADGKKFVICSLKEGVCENAALDLILDEDLTFQVKGDATVHLTGYYLPASDDEDLASGSESEGEEFSSDEDGVALLHPDDIDSDDLTSEGESDLEEAHGRLDVEIKELDEEDVVVTTTKALPAPEAKPAPAGAKRKAPDSKAEPEPETKKGAAAQKAAPAQKTAAKKAEAATPAQKPAAKPAQAATPKPAEAAKPAAAAAKTPKTRTFPNGFEITTVKQGLPDAKVAKAGKTVVVKYTGRLKTNGKVFDSTKGNKTFNFKLGVGEVIKGWDRGVDGMRVGEKRRLIIPPQMGYGGTGAGKVIPPNAWLDFEVELVNVRG